MSRIKTSGEQVSYDTTLLQETAEQLQTLLNSIGLHLRVNGVAGGHTSDAYKTIAGSFLKGDDRQ